MTPQSILRRAHPSEHLAPEENEDEFEERQNNPNNRTNRAQSSNKNLPSYALCTTELATFAMSSAGMSLAEIGTSDAET